MVKSTTGLPRLVGLCTPVNPKPQTLSPKPLTSHHRVLLRLRLFPESPHKRFAARPGSAGTKATALQSNSPIPRLGSSLQALCQKAESEKKRLRGVSQDFRACSVRGFHSLGGWSSSLSLGVQKLPNEPLPLPNQRIPKHCRFAFRRAFTS